MLVGLNSDMTAAQRHIVSRRQGIRLSTSVPHLAVPSCCMVLHWASIKSIVASRICIDRPSTNPRAYSASVGARSSATPSSVWCGRGRMQHES